MAIDSRIGELFDPSSITTVPTSKASKVEAQDKGKSYAKNALLTVMDTKVYLLNSAKLRQYYTGCTQLSANSFLAGSGTDSFTYYHDKETHNKEVGTGGDIDEPNDLRVTGMGRTFRASTPLGLHMRLFPVDINSGVDIEGMADELYNFYNHEYDDGKKRGSTFRPHIMCHGKVNYDHSSLPGNLHSNPAITWIKTRDEGLKGLQFMRTKHSNMFKGYNWFRPKVHGGYGKDMNHAGKQFIGRDSAPHGSHFFFLMGGYQLAKSFKADNIVAFFRSSPTEVLYDMLYLNYEFQSQNEHQSTIFFYPTKIVAPCFKLSFGTSGFLRSFGASKETNGDQKYQALINSNRLSQVNYAIAMETYGVTINQWGNSCIIPKVGGPSLDEGEIQHMFIYNPISEDPDYMTCYPLSVYGKLDELRLNMYSLYGLKYNLYDNAKVLQYVVESEFSADSPNDNSYNLVFSENPLISEVLDVDKDIFHFIESVSTTKMRTSLMEEKFRKVSIKSGTIDHINEFGDNFTSIPREIKEFVLAKVGNLVSDGMQKVTSSITHFSESVSNAVSSVVGSISTITTQAVSQATQAAGALYQEITEAYDAVIQFIGIIKKNRYYYSTSFNDPALNLSLKLTELKYSLSDGFANKRSFLIRIADLIGIPLSINIVSDTSGIDRLLDKIDVKIDVSKLGEGMGSMILKVLEGTAKSIVSTVSIIDNVLNMIGLPLTNVCINSNFHPVRSSNGDLYGLMGHAFYSVPRRVPGVHYIAHYAGEYSHAYQPISKVGNNDLFTLVKISSEEEVKNLIRARSDDYSAMWAILDGTYDSSIRYYPHPTALDYLAAEGMVIAQSLVASGTAALTASGFVGKLVAAGAAAASVLLLNQVTLGLGVDKNVNRTRNTRSSYLYSEENVFIKDDTFNVIAIKDLNAILSSTGSNIMLMTQAAQEALAVTGGIALSAMIGIISGTIAKSITNFKTFSALKDVYKNSDVIRVGGLNLSPSDLNGSQRRAVIKAAVSTTDSSNNILGSIIGNASSFTKDVMLKAIDASRSLVSKFSSGFSDTKLGEAIFGKDDIEKLLDEAASISDSVNTVLESTSKISSEVIPALGDISGSVSDLDSKIDSNNSSSANLAANISQALESLSQRLDHNLELNGFSRRLLESIFVIIEKFSGVSYNTDGTMNVNSVVQVSDILRLLRFIRGRLGF